MDYIRAHLDERLAIADLARHCCVRPRHFARLFKVETGFGPAKAVERLRVDAARAALESGSVSVKRLAITCGFGDAERMRRSFLRTLGAPPSQLRRRQRTPPGLPARARLRMIPS